MKKIIIATFLFFFLSINSQANDIRDYEIEGIKIGDSILSFYSIEKIETGLQDFYSDKTFLYTEISDSKIKKFDKIGFFFKPEDKVYKIYSVALIKYCPNDIQICNDIKKEIEKNFKTNFKLLRKKTNIMKYSDGGNNGTGSVAIQSYWDFKNGSVFIETKDWATDSIYTDNVSLNIDSKELNDWLMKISN